MLTTTHDRPRARTWVQYEVLVGVASSKKSERAAVIKKMIQVADALRTLNNFNGCMAVVSGLVSSPLIRLQRIWSVRPPRGHCLVSCLAWCRMALVVGLLLGLPFAVVLSQINRIKPGALRTWFRVSRGVACLW